VRAEDTVLVFCEYRILEEHRSAFLEWVRRHPERWAGVLLLENETQPGVFVELRLARDGGQALRMEEERRAGRSGFGEMESWVKGGRDGVRVWRFRPVQGRVTDVIPNGS